LPHLARCGLAIAWAKLSAVPGRPDLRTTSRRLPRTPLDGIITLDKSIQFPGNIIWDGKYVVVGDQEYEYSASGFYESAIFQTTGASGKVVNVIPLTGTGDVVGFSIDGKTLIGPDNQWENVEDVFFWNYPAGGKPTKTPEGFDAPYGTTISVGK
jgi:hypothetical protein